MMKTGFFTFTAIVFSTTFCFGEAGTLLATFPIGATNFAVNSHTNEIYATAGNTLAVIDARNLALTDQDFIGSNPYGVAVSPDGTRVYTANRGSQVSAIGVYDVASQSPLPPIALPVAPVDVAVGTNHRVYASPSGAATSYGILQADGITGDYLGDFAPRHAYSGGLLQITPDSSTLVHQRLGSSPSYAYVFDVSAGPGAMMYSVATGYNGQDLAMSSDGYFFAAPNGAPYSIGLRRTSDGAVLGTLGTGAYPREVAVSPDGAYAYAVHTRGEIDVFDVATFTHLDTWNVSGEASELIVDPTGRYLFAAFSGELRVYDTGYFVPEPSTGIILLLGALPIAVRVRRSHASRAV